MSENAIRILYVEDNEDNVYMLTRRLTRKGYDLMIATNGKDGVETAKREQPALILMDLSLPVMDGWTAAGVLKADPATRAIPIIALSAHAMVEDRAKALDAGCDDYDTKPVDINRLLGKMQALLPS